MQGDEHYAHTQIYRASLSAYWIGQAKNQISILLRKYR